MTTEEMFQLLLNEIKNLHLGQARLEAKIDANHTEVMTHIQRIESDVQYLKQNDDSDTLSINSIHGDIKEIKEKVNSLDKQTNIVRVLDKSVPSLHTRVSDLEDEMRAVKDKLDKAS